MTLLVAIVAAALPTQAPEPPPPYWTQVDSCHHGHRAGVAIHGRRGLDWLLRNHRPLTPARADAVAHLRTCAMSRAGRRRVERRARQLRIWRTSYAHVWRIRFNRLAPWERAWAISTGACESGNNPRAATGNGFYGAHQWLPSTWYAADNTGIFVTDASWWHQAVVAVRWMHVAGASQWPVCGV